jgi:hypothetical protein
MLTRQRSVDRFKLPAAPLTREQQIAKLDQFTLWNYWLIEDGEHPSINSKRVREKIDRLLDARPLFDEAK